ncbi:unnamed protein product, partial [Iphiclides podalirius]
MKACLCVCLVIVAGAVGQRCGPNEHFEVCGSPCPRTCQNPNPICIPRCASGCFCNRNRVRDEKSGECIEPSSCTSQSARRKRGLFQDPVCKENEDFRLCETCYKSCDNPKPSCSEHCERGCFCKDGLTRNRDGKCVKPEECPADDGSNNAKQHAARNKSCGPHKVFQQCRRCEKTCSERRPLCSGPCRSGCFCKDGFLKHPNGQCVKLQECPKEVTIIGAREPSVEDCGSDEEFLSCGWCEPSCSEPAPRCPAGVCTRGCLCRPPLLRHYSGRCVHERACLPQSCPDPSEEYVCRYGCEPRCDGRTCDSRPRRCSLGCHCRLGLRRHASGRCVAPDQCAAPTPTQPQLPAIDALPPPAIDPVSEFENASRATIKI